MCILCICEICSVWEKQGSYADLLNSKMAHVFFEGIKFVVIRHRHGRNEHRCNYELYYTKGYSKHIHGSLVFQFRNYIILSGC